MHLVHAREHFFSISLALFFVEQSSSKLSSHNPVFMRKKKCLFSAFPLPCHTFPSCFGALIQSIRTGFSHSNSHFTISACRHFPPFSLFFSMPRWSASIYRVQTQTNGVFSPCATLCARSFPYPGSICIHFHLHEKSSVSVSRRLVHIINSSFIRCRWWERVPSGARYKKKLGTEWKRCSGETRESESARDGTAEDRKEREDWQQAEGDRKC